MKQLLIPVLLAAMLVGCGKPKPAVDIWAAAGSGTLEALKQNLATGINVDAREPAGGSTPLIVAALFGRTEAATLLIQKGANINARKNDGATALHVAAFFCQPDTVQLLLDKGAGVSAKNNSDATPLDLVSGELTPELQNAYVYIAGYLHMPLDLEAIKRGRPEMAERLRNARDK
jgi:ankyrin repeat protein